MAIAAAILTFGSPSPALAAGDPVTPLIPLFAGWGCSRDIAPPPAA
jgi:hypothetical protein